ncbi:hypothetical protein M431DRAFT_373707 [Trichoderma harzianum CBS 226.95]|uniref:Uncharacterized protein n=1 Tax=Trichoderma harzianum CBS 226.95 TaxID=983964 RepID=A0A2T4AH70_TRIHA|nr:hypothetical protein M431DRAFT_373707 [Trichoderma harzianum CBS 226.95]PTB56352.1 hypothetical protein M431DRAFT_373707 [Trichoderma harzianum CBS 226.95]
MALTAVAIFVISVKIIIQPCGFCPGIHIQPRHSPCLVSTQYHLRQIPQLHTFFPSPSSYHSQLLLHPALYLHQIPLNYPSFPLLLLHPSHKPSRRSTHLALHPTSHVIHHPFLMSFLFLSETPLSHPPRLILAAHSPPIRRFIIKPPTLSSESSHPQKTLELPTTHWSGTSIIAPPFQRIMIIMP